MRYLSLDIKTTGLDPEADQIIEFAAIYEDTNNILSFNEIPKFQAIVAHERYSGNAYAINMNQRIFKILSDPDIMKKQYKDLDNIKEIYTTIKFLAKDFYDWLIKIDPIYLKDKMIFAGKNFNGFDLKFLKKVPDWNYHIKSHHRSIDPAVLYIDFTSDIEPPSLDKCLIRAHLLESVTHQALYDAWDVIRVLRARYEINNYSDGIDIPKYMFQSPQPLFKKNY